MSKGDYQVKLAEAQYKWDQEFYRHLYSKKRHEFEREFLASLDQYVEDDLSVRGRVGRALSLAYREAEKRISVASGELVTARQDLQVATKGVRHWEGMSVSGS